MLRKWRMACLACLTGLVVNAGLAQAQPAAAPAAPPAPATPTAASAAGVEAKPGFFKKLCDACEECKRKICKTPAGAMLNNMTKPLTLATGGIIPPFCPQFPSAADLAQAGVAGAAAAGKKDALEAAARKDAVRFLGTLDCRYFPAAAKALAAALRTDPSECVRYEAALVLNRGCCCTQTTINALEASVSGTEMDGNPAERSGRVRCAAATALEKCLGCYVAPPQEPAEVIMEKEETKPGEATPGTAPAPLPSAKMSPGSKMPTPEQVERARKTLQTFNEMLAFHKAPSAVAQAQAKSTLVLPAGQQSLFHILKATEEAPEPIKAMPIQQAAANVPSAIQTASMPSMPAPAMPAPATAEMPKGMPMVKEPVVITPVVVVDEPVVAPKMVIPPQLNIEPKEVPAEKIAESKVVESKVVESKVVEMKRTETPVELPGKVIAVMPAKKVEEEVKPVSASVPTDKASEAVMELARKVTQNKSVSERHAAIRQIVKYDWKKNPMVASALILGATSDKEPAVRVDCMRHMVVYKVTHPQVLTELAGLQNDPDVWVRQEAVQTLSLLKAME